MQYYEKYIVTNRLRKKVICGNVNLPYGTECSTVDFGNTKAIVCENGIVCCVTSQDAYDYFSQNDDGNGKERARMINDIFKALNKLKLNNSKKYNEVWYDIWHDEICLKYKRTDHENYWVWNYDFYNAPLFDLQYIAKLVGAK